MLLDDKKRRDLQLRVQQHIRKNIEGSGYWAPEVAQSKWNDAMAEVAYMVEETYATYVKELEAKIEQLEDRISERDAMDAES
jgi:recombinational DNA repair ATPase RecF